MNVALIVLIGFAFHWKIIPPDSSKLATISMAFLLQLQVSALLLNLLPVPPLDGFQAIAPWLPAQTRATMSGAANLGMFIVFIVLLATPAGRLFWDVVTEICTFLGARPRWASLGYEAFKFWEN
jgi:Zn-dependent protease